MLLLDGYGGSNSYSGNKGYPYLLSGTRSETLFRLLDQSPVIVGVTGPVAGVTSGRVAASHFSVMAQSGRVFAGSAMAAAALDEETATAVGGPRTQAIRSGTVDNVALDEDDLFAQIRTVLSYLPTNVDEEPPFLDVGDPPDRWCDELLDIVPDNRRRPFNAQQMIEAVVDDGSFFELAPAYGRALVAGVARVAGQAVGVFSSNPYVNAGAMDLPACEKQTRVAELCDTFHLPMVYFADVPGFMIGIEAERSGLMRRGVRAMQAVHRATVPVVTIQVRRSYGLAGNATVRTEPAERQDRMAAGGVGRHAHRGRRRRALPPGAGGLRRSGGAPRPDRGPHASRGLHLGDGRVVRSGGHHRSP